MEKFLDFGRISIIVVLIATTAGRLAAGLISGSFETLLLDTFAFGILITLIYGFVLSMLGLAVSAVLWLKERLGQKKQSPV